MATYNDQPSQPFPTRQVAIGGAVLGTGYGVHRGLRRLGVYKGPRAVKRRIGAFFRRRKKAAAFGERLGRVQAKSEALKSGRRIGRASQRILNVAEGRGAFSSGIKGWKAVRGLKGKARIGGLFRRIARTGWRLRHF